jgi:hypothetical protein
LLNFATSGEVFSDLLVYLCSGLGLAGGRVVLLKV